MRKITLLTTTLGAAMLAAVPISLHRSPTMLSLDTANARIGNPLSAGSIAGVHRRVYRRNARRGYYGTGVVAATAAGAYYGSAPSYNGGYVNHSTPAVYDTTSHETTADTHHLALDAEQHAYCLSRTYNVGPCQ